MSVRTTWLGAVAYDAKVVPIWEGMRRYFRDEARIAVEVVLFQTYEAQVQALLASHDDPAPRIDIAWNTNLAFLQAREWSAKACRPLAMRDTDLGWTTVIIAPSGGAVASVADLRGRTIALGSRDSGHAAILPVHFLAQQGLVEGRDYRALRINTDVGKHGDTGTSEVEVLRAVLDGRADAGAVGSPFWSGVQDQQIVPTGALSAVWSSPPYSHCMFTARVDLEPEIGRRFTEALIQMSLDNPLHKPILEAEGLKRWIPADLDGYGALDQACRAQGFFVHPATQPD
ncbi:MAG TPA: phosphate/phosphite/phosphonate ABC transporter substrate-binding protein [Gemmatimonadaceae bacterium]|nr:phosphate/phosphite/phosphonate ABC transporter substrate-binding protein [Gemmatimonadaceae bacterium]